MTTKIRPKLTPEISEFIDQNYSPEYGSITRIKNQLKNKKGLEISEYLISKYLRMKGLEYRDNKKNICRRWIPEEDKILQNNAGLIPIENLTIKINKFCNTHGLSNRNKGSVEARCCFLGLSIDVSGIYYTPKQLTTILGCSDPKINAWIKEEYAGKILNPIKSSDNGKNLIHVDNLKKFIVAYRSILVENFNPDWEFILSLFE